MNWAVNAYNESREVRLSENYVKAIFDANVNDVKSLTKASLNEALCYFIPEVTKSKGQGMYPGRTLYQLVIGIKKHLNVCKVHWKLIDDIEFDDIRIVLDNVMKERASLQIGTIRKQADVITYKQEEKMWNEGILGEDSPDTLRNCTLFTWS